MRTPLRGQEVFLPGMLSQGLELHLEIRFFCCACRQQGESYSLKAALVVVVRSCNKEAGWASIISSSYAPLLEKLIRKPVGFIFFI